MTAHIDRFWMTEGDLAGGTYVYGYVILWNATNRQGELYFNGKLISTGDDLEALAETALRHEAEGKMQ